MSKSKVANRPVHIYFVLDRSGSMESIRGDVIGGFNAFLKEQKELPDKASLTLIQFDTQDAFEVVYDALPLNQVPELSMSTFVPRAGTPLYDAMGHAIAEATIRAEKKKEELVLFVIFTDGEENSSKEYTREKVFEAIAKREKEGWTFAYLGANQDAMQVGLSMGIAAGATRGYDATAKGTQTAFALLSNSTAQYRASNGAVGSASFFEEGKKKQKKPSK